jgi:hypothetical protein
MVWGVSGIVPAIRGALTPLPVAKETKASRTPLAALSQLLLILDRAFNR